jgi:hypothetical protein
MSLGHPAADHDLLALRHPIHHGLERPRDERRVAVGDRESHGARSPDRRGLHADGEGRPLVEQAGGAGVDRGAQGGDDVLLAVDAVAPRQQAEDRVTVPPRTPRDR